MNAPTTQEVKWALRLKEKALSDEQIKPVSDFEYLEHAIIAKDNVEKGLNRLCKLQAFREEHGLQGDLDEAGRDLHIFRTTLCPGMFLCLAQCPVVQHIRTHILPQEGISEQGETVRASNVCSSDSDEKIDLSSLKSEKLSEAEPHDSTGTSRKSVQVYPESVVPPHVLCFDMSKVTNARISNNEAHSVALRGLYHCMQIVNCNVASIRAGYSFLGDTRNMGYQNFCPKLERKASRLYGRIYPVRVRNNVFLNTNWMVRAFYNFIARFLPFKARKFLIFAGDLDEFLDEHGRMDDSRTGFDADALRSSAVYYPKDVLPKTWGGFIDENDVQVLLMAQLRERKQNERTFRLHSSPLPSLQESSETSILE